MSPIVTATPQAEPSSSLSWVVEAASSQVSLLRPPPQPVSNTRSQKRVLLTHKLDHLTFLFSSPYWFPSHSIQKPKSSLWPTRTLHDLPPSLPTLITLYPPPPLIVLQLHWASHYALNTSGKFPPQGLRTCCSLCRYALLPKIAQSIPSSSRLYSDVPWPLSTISTLSQHFLFSFFYLDFFPCTYHTF